MPPSRDRVHVPESVMVVEDNIMIALDTEALLKNIGVRKTTITATVADTFAALEKSDFDFVLLDINLGAEDSLSVAQALTARRIPFSLATGYGRMAALDDRFAGMPVLHKPYSERDLLLAISTRVS